MEDVLIDIIHPAEDAVQQGGHTTLPLQAKLLSVSNPTSVTGKSFAFRSWILIHNPWVESLKSTLGILMWFFVSTVIAYHIGIVDQNPMLGTRNFSL